MQRITPMSDAAARVLAHCETACNDWLLPSAPPENLMPLIRPLSGAAIAVAIACLAATGTPAPAHAASCNYTQTSQLFAAWGDNAAYTPFQGAGFENGASGWSWGNGANIVS